MALSDSHRPLICKAADYLAKARSILFITGAGLSADSDLPTYRGIGGLYEDKDPEEGIPIEEALSGDMMVRRLDITWKYISQIEGASRQARHNRGHEVIAEMEQHFPKVWVLTQNVDGFHQDAGSRNVIDIHGNIKTLLCRRCHFRREVNDYSELEIPPVCPQCAGPERPDVVLFGEQLPMNKLSRLRQVSEEGFQMVFSIGTSSLFQYIVEPVLDARRWNVPTVEVNPGVTPISEMVDVKIPAGAAETLDAIWEAYRENL